MQIRIMEQADYILVEQLLQRMHQQHVDQRPEYYQSQSQVYSQESFQQLLADEQVIATVILLAGKVIGVCIARLVIKQGDIDVPVAYIDQLCVDYQLHGQGVGKKLFHDISNRAKVRGAKRIELAVWSFNQRALDFYLSCGMHPQRYIFEREI
ncbi:MAG: GNAT family N-acetyltransferase [Culicoidibacterales bacterium]